MKEFKSEQTRSGQHLNLRMSGEISMTTDLPRIDLKGLSELTIDLQHVSYINSAGVRKWMVWMTSVSNSVPQLKINLLQIPYVMTKQIMSIENFIPKAAIISSIFVPYFCDSCEESTDKLIERDKDYGPGIAPDKVLSVVRDAKCPKCGKPMEVDAIPEFYVKMLEQH